MFSPWDEYYLETKRIKLEHTPLPSPFNELADWIVRRYRVDVLNIVYDRVIPDNRPRLYVILDREADALKFRKGFLGNFISQRQREVSAEFGTLLRQQRDRRFDVDRLFVVFGAFESDARREAHANVSEDAIQALQQRLNNNDLWLIRRLFETVTFFFYTDQQVKKYEAQGKKDIYAQEYSQLLEAHDQFGYVRENAILVRFDSKENFETKFKGNWFYYDR